VDRVFPKVEARDLEGTRVVVPDDLAGDRNVLLVAFRREHQALVDSWVPWLEARAADDAGLRYYELPTIGIQWSPGRRVIDGGMASAIPDPAVRRRTLTIYTDVRRVTTALALETTRTIAVVLADRAGCVHWQGAGGFAETTADALGAALRTTTPRAAPGPTQFEFAFEPRYRWLLAGIGVTPSTAYVTLTDDAVVARFGPWSCATPFDNIIGMCVTGPYRGYRAIGPRGSLADRGLTFGTTTAGGVCLRLRTPVRGLEPTGRMRHPGITLTLADVDGFARAITERTGIEVDTVR
jgi:hypothetical protein